MGIISTIRSWIYQLLVRSHIVYYLFPVVLPFLLKSFLNTEKNKNCDVVDKKGKSFGVCKVNGRVFPGFGVERIRTIPQITVRDSDVMLCGFPKTGCHWTHEILHMLVTGKAELSKYGKGPVGMLEAIPDFILDSVPSPRILNSHVMFEELPIQLHAKKTKIVLTVRNPKDTVVSYFNHVMNQAFAYNYDGEFDDFFDLFIDGKLEYGSYFDYMLNWDEYIKKPTTNEIMMIAFEEMRAQPVESVKRLAKFINVDVTDQFVRDVVDEADIKNMRKKSEKNGSGSSKLLRKGKVGDWHNWLSDEQSAAIDKMWKDRMTNCSYQPQYD